jgi:hypothetical protein
MAREVIKGAHQHLSAPLSSMATRHLWTISMTWDRGKQSGGGRPGLWVTARGDPTSALRADIYGIYGRNDIYARPVIPARCAAASPE